MGAPVDIEQLFDESYGRILSHEVDGKGFFLAFYDHFLEASPEVAEKFRHTDMARQQSMLKKAFYHLLTFYASNHADYYLHEIAVSHGHTHLDIPPRLYDLWLEALITTVRRFDDYLTDEAELAWRLVMAPGIVYMKFHYEPRDYHATSRGREGPKCSK